MILYFGNIHVIANKCSKPMFSKTQGRKWVEAVFTIDDREIKCCFDERMGNGIYFEDKKNWYCFPIDAEFYHSKKGVAHICFHPEKEKIKFTSKEKITHEHD